MADLHGHEIEGIGVEFVPPFLKQIPVDGFYTISDEDGFLGQTISQEKRFAGGKLQRRSLRRH